MSITTAATAMIAPVQIPTPISNEPDLPHREAELLETLRSVVEISLSLSILAASRPATAKPKINIKTPIIVVVTNGQYALHIDSSTKSF